MQKTRLKFVIIGLFILLVTSVILVYTFSTREYEAFLCTKSVTLKGEEQNIVEFYMPSPASAVRFDFNISSGTIKYLAEPSSHFNSNQSYFQQYVDDCITRQFPIPFEVDNGPTGFGWNAGWTIADGENPENLDEEQVEQNAEKLNEEYVDQIWYLYLFNEDSYDKEVQISISKTWEP